MSLKSKRTKLDVEDISFNFECDSSPVMNDLLLQDYYQLHNYILFESGDGHVASTVKSGTREWADATPISFNLRSSN